MGGGAGVERVKSLVSEMLTLRCSLNIQVELPKSQVETKSRVQGRSVAGGTNAGVMTIRRYLSPQKITSPKEECRSKRKDAQGRNALGHSNIQIEK